IDYKGENAKITAKFRKWFGRIIILLDPYKLLTNNPATSNPLDSIDPDSSECLDNCRDLAKELAVRDRQNEKDPHFGDRGEGFMSAVIYFVVKTAPPEDRNL